MSVWVLLMTAVPGWQSAAEPFGVSSASAAFHIIITNASGSFLHARLQFSNPIADTESIIPVRIFTGASRHKVLSLSMIIVCPVFLHKVVTIDIQ